MAYSDNHYDHFIPEIWSQELIMNFDKTCVMRNLVNTKYEGEIKNYGDTVKIQGTGTVSVGLYTRGQTLTPSAIVPAEDSLTIDKPYYFMFEVDDLDVAQSHIDIIGTHTYRAGVALRNQIDTLLLAEYANAGNTIGTTAVGIDLSDTNVDIYKKIVDMGVLFDEDDVPGEGRWLVVPPRVAGVIQKNSYFVDAAASGDGGAMLRTGRIGDIAGFQIYKSSNLVAVDADSSSGTASVFPCLAGTPEAISFAMQVTKMEAARPADTFTTIVKGLVCFGYKTIKTNALGVMYVKSTTI